MNSYNPKKITPLKEVTLEAIQEKEISLEEFLREGISLDGGIEITQQIAEKLERILNIPAHFWINYQKHYDRVK